MKFDSRRKRASTVPQVRPASGAHAPDLAPRFLAVARIARPQGRRGEVVAEILTDFPERFQHLRRAYLEEPGGEPRRVEIENAWPHKGRIVLKLQGTESIEDAEQLRGRLVLIERAESVKLPAHHYYVWELEGCRVLCRVGDGAREIGTVTEVERTPGGDLLHIARPGGHGELLIPLAQEICTRIDPAARTIWIEPPENLLELNE